MVNTLSQSRGFENIGMNSHQIYIVPTNIKIMYSHCEYSTPA